MFECGELRLSPPSTHPRRETPRADSAPRDGQTIVCFCPLSSTQGVDAVFVRFVGLQFPLPKTRRALATAQPCFYAHSSVATVESSAAALRRAKVKSAQNGDAFRRLCIAFYASEPALKRYPIAASVKLDSAVDRHVTEFGLHPFRLFPAPDRHAKRRIFFGLTTNIPSAPTARRNPGRFLGPIQMRTPLGDVRAVIPAGDWRAQERRTAISRPRYFSRCRRGAAPGSAPVGRGFSGGPRASARGEVG